MDEWHDNPPKPERLKEDEDKLMSDIPQDATANVQNDPKQTGDKTNGDQEIKGSDFAFSSQVVLESDPSKLADSCNNNETICELDQLQKGNSADTSKPESACISQEMGNKNFLSVQRENDPMESDQGQEDYGKTGLKQWKNGSVGPGHGDQRTPGWDDGEIEIPQGIDTCNAIVRNPSQNTEMHYLPFAHSRGPPQSHQYVVALPQGALQSSSNITTLPQGTTVSHSHVNTPPQDNPQSYPHFTAHPPGTTQNYWYVTTNPQGVPQSFWHATALSQQTPPSYLHLTAHSQGTPESSSLAATPPQETAESFSHNATPPQETTERFSYATTPPQGMAETFLHASTPAQGTPGSFSHAGTHPPGTTQNYWYLTTHPQGAPHTFWHVAGHSQGKPESYPHAPIHPHKTTESYPHAATYPQQTPESFSHPTAHSQESYPDAPTHPQGATENYPHGDTRPQGTPQSYPDVPTHPQGTTESYPHGDTSPQGTPQSYQHPPTHQKGTTENYPNGDTRPQGTPQSYPDAPKKSQGTPQSFSHCTAHSQRTTEGYPPVTAVSQGMAQSCPTHVLPGNIERKYSEVAGKTTQEKATPTTQRPTKVDFYLLILGDYTIDQACIRSGPNATSPLELIDKDSSLWKCSKMLPGDPLKHHFKYKYRLVRKKHDVMQKNPSDYCDEPVMRIVESYTQFDVFYFPTEKEHVSETVPKSIIFYLKWLFQFVEPLTISKILTQIESFHFVNLCPKHVKECVDWILDNASSSTVSSIQLFYLCVVLSNLDQFLSRLQLPNEKKTVKACDHFLQCLGTNVFSDLLSQPNLQRLGKIAFILVKNSSSPQWLTLAAYFYPYLGIQFVVDEKNTKGLKNKYEVEEYKKLLGTLLSHMKKKNGNIHDPNQDLLSMALKQAPGLTVVSDLFKGDDMHWLFNSEDEKLSFFVKFYQGTVQSSNKQKESPGAKLIEFYKIPEKIRNKMRTFLFSTLLEYARSDDEFNNEQENIFVQSVTFEKYLEMYEVLDILSELSKSKSDPRQKLLLEILNNECFGKDWRETPFSRKVDICKLWVITRVVNKRRARSLSAMEKIATVYEAIDEIMKCFLNMSNKDLAQYVSSDVVERLLKGVKVVSVLEAFSRIEKCAAVVKDNYKFDVCKILEQTPKMAKKPKMIPYEILNECAKTSLGQDLLAYIVDIIVPEIATKSPFNENDFKSLLEWRDIWIVLFTIKGTLQDSRKCLAAKRVCQQLEMCIKNGNISISFLEVVEKEREKVSLLCASVLNDKSTEKGDLTDCQSQILKKISKLAQIRDEYLKKFQLLDAAITCVNKISKDICLVNGIESAFDKCNCLKKTWRDNKVFELQGDEFWETLQPFLEPAKALQPLTNSVSFMAVAKKGLKESISSLDGNESETKANIDFFTLIMLLATKTKEDFEAYWNAMFEDSGSIDVETMKTLLVLLKDEDQVYEEIKLLEKYFEQEFSSTVKANIEDYVKYPNVLERVGHIISILEIFRVTDPANKVMKEFSQFQTLLQTSGNLTPALPHNCMEEVKEIVLSFPGDIDGVIEQLARSTELLRFIEEIIEEDIRFLIDAVEEHSDQFLSEVSVSDLIDVHGFLAPLIKKRNEDGCNPEDFLATLRETCLGHEEIETKIEHCKTNVNSLRGLYQNIANRGQVTKEIINNCLNKGEYWVSQKDGKCEAYMTYVLQDKLCNYSLPDLLDLRSRAHLITTSHKNGIKLTSSQLAESSGEIDFDAFINQVNLLTEISILLSKLLSSGYVGYRKFWRKMKTSEDLKANKDSLQQDLENWENILEKARENYYFLNFYRSDQICKLYDFLTNNDTNCDEVLALIHFLDPTITEQQLQQYRESQQLKTSDSSDNPDLLITTVGEALLKIFSHWQGAARWILHDGERSSYSNLETTVAPGTIFVATLEPESLLTANVILTLYENTSNAFPEPYQIVFCSSETTWEELHLLLQRCFAHSQNHQYENLFCIANVELLPNELQFRLVDAIKEKQQSYPSSGNKRSADYQLALICRGGDHHHIVEQFSQYSHHIAGMSDPGLADRLKSGWPDVKMITSTLPGLGKTEKIKSEAVEKSMNVVTFSISGPFKSSKLIQRFQNLKITKHHCLHLDIGEVSDPLLLDMFLFQLIVTGMVSAGNQFYHLPTKHIYIEIANTLKDWLRESLVVSKHFTSIHLEWNSYKDFLVSTKITSNTQVVCQYLNIFDRDCLESKEVLFSGPEKSKPLSASRCHELLVKYFSSDANTTFTTLRIFLRVLADQLLKFSKSAFFKIENLDTMVGEEAQDVRKNLFQALLQVSKDFACRAITACPSSDTRNLSQQESARALDEAMVVTARSVKDMVERVKGMIQWEDNNHLLVVFHGWNSQAITAVYRNMNFVPSNVKKLLESQVVRENRELEDFCNFTQEQLREKLEKIACMKQPVKEKTVGCIKKRRKQKRRTCLKQPENENISSQYALTPDNILKMILIILRVRVKIPIIIMGETGCGKSSLVRYLANTCGVQFYTFNIHAGISDDDIIEFIEEKETQVRDVKQQIWIFFDEINTCDHLGLISDIMCHHSLLGRPLSKYLVFLAACNPYKERPIEHIQTAGLEGKNITDEYSKLVYRVHPLPEAITDYVWDYGSLAPKDERDYIKRMVKGLPAQYEDMLVDLLAASQEFIRDAERNPFCVSLRDVYRCIRLIGWFQEMMKTREELGSLNSECCSYLKKYYSMSEEYNGKPVIKSIVLALAHCYMSRLPTSDLRERYRKCMMTMFLHRGTKMSCDGNVDSFAAIVRMEEEDYLDRMELPEGTARNAALRENVFVMLVCILNRIPVFVVGKPGCSKSLSIQLIRSNLRGRDSKDPLFRELPQLYVVSYQGSESSTSEGIIKVFEKARKYKDTNKDILPVVLLDEVGLAENSKYNPLKVLHSLLEPGEGKLPYVAVVGISNWSLDAAKMNRAIHLSRPEPTKEDLYDTGYSLHYANGKDNSQQLGQKELQCLAEAYFEYQDQQTHENFHGLRDYYSLIKSLTGSCDFQQINISLQRNFGGLPSEITNIQKIFFDKLEKHMICGPQDIIPVTQLIQNNLEDHHARHLMLKTSGDSAIGILEQSLEQLGKETITIYGSRFEEDLSEEYNYRILSRIILCMERDCILILRDLESIYGSLYDMLNQNYAVVGNRKNCRVALGAYNNPMCQVNDGFRCVVLIDEHKVDYSDPPFLNRFEKQVLRFSDVLTNNQQNIIDELHRWVQGVSTVEGLQSHFNETDMFIGFHKDTLPSLVYSQGHDGDSSQEELLKKCKDELMWTASPDGVLRTQKCNFSKENFEEVHDFSAEYLKKPLHQGFAFFMEHVKTNHQGTSFFASDEVGSKTVVMTFSNIHTDIRQCLGSGFNCQVERLSAYKSEKQLAERVNEFWNAPEKELFVLQCKLDLDGQHLLLARSIIEEKRNSYQQCLSEIKAQDYKHVCIVLHVQRGQAEKDVPWQFNFLCGWRQVFLDVLEAPAVPLNEIIGKTVQKLLTSSVWPICKIARNDLLWCFTRINYTGSQQRADFILRNAKNLLGSKKISEVIEKLILQSIDLNASEQDQEAYAQENWHVQVACDRQSLTNSSTLHCAMEHFVSRLVRNPLAKIVYFLEKENAWPLHLVVESTEMRLPKLEDLWCQFIMNKAIFKMSDIPDPLGAKSYVFDSTSYDLCLPFSQVIMRKVDGVKEVFLEDDATLAENENNLDDNYQLKPTVRQQQLERFSKMIINLVPELLCLTSDYYDLYMKDLFDMTTADFSPMLNRLQRVSIVEAMFVSEVRQNLPAKDMPEFFTILHTFVWLHREEILDLLRMVECCQPFVPLEVLLNVMSDVLDSLNEVTFVKCQERSDGFDNEPQRKEKAAINEIDNSHETASNPEQDTDEFDQGKTMFDDFECEWGKQSQDFQENQEAVKDEKDNKETIKEEVENGHSKRFGDILVTAYCEEMLPSPETVEKNGGLDSWIRNANLLLSLSFKISEQSPAFHYLRLCLDFSRIIIASAALSTSLSSLYIFNEIGTALRPEYLDHDQSFEKITNEMIKPLEEDMKDHADKQEALQKFSALFYGRCIDTNVDTSAVRPIVEQILSLERPELVMMMNPVVLRLLLIEQMQSPDIFTDLISNPSVIVNFPCLQNIDEVFKDRFSSDVIHHDSYPAVMICDLIQFLLSFDYCFKIDDIDTPECRILMLARAAIVLTSQNSEDGCGLSLFSSMAFLRGFFKMLAQFIAGNPTVLKEDSPYIHVMTEVTSLLKDTKLSLQEYFLKQLHERASLFLLQKWFSESNILPPITELWRKENTHDKAIFTSAFRFPEYEKVKAAYWKLTSNDDSSMCEFFMKCSSSPNHAFALLGILINMVYLKRAVRKLTKKEEQLVDWFVGKVSSFPFLLQELLLRILGRRDFHCPQLQLSIESSVEEVEMALLVLHIACVVATGGQSEMLPMYRYFTNPASFELPCVLAYCKEEMRSVFEYQSSIKNSVCVTCPCGLRLAFKVNVTEKVCPQCHEVLNDEANNSKCSPPVETLPVLPNSGSRPQWDLCTESMSPAVHCALHFIVNSSYYAGIAFLTSSEQKLTGASFENMEHDLSCLMKILSCNKNAAIQTMHLVVEKSSDLIRGDNLLEANDCSTPRMRREWESKFAQLTETVLLNARKTSKEVKKMMKLQQLEDNDEITLECRILELDKYPEKPKEQNQQLKRLFRVTKQPCLEDFRSAFLYSSKDVQTKHTFLILFFARYDQLQMIGHLHPLLKWSRAVSSALTHRISRKDAQSKPINDFITGHLLDLKRDQKDTESLKKLFAMFKTAWNEMRPFVNETLKEKREMPRLREADGIAYCLTESECGFYLETAIKILVSYQNSVLDAAISLSSHQKFALSFLEKQNCSGIICTSLQNVKEKEIIRFQWSDDLFQHAQNNLDYGKGQEILYDFERIEMKLAKEIVFGKCYLTGTLNKFIFANELFHSCGPLLTEMRSLLTQSPSLPDEVLKGVSALKERRIKDAHDLLQHIEVLIFLITQKLKTPNVDMTLEVFIEQLPMLPSPFPVTLLPEPRSSLKIKHVAALYEALEDVLADGAIEGLADKFRDEMPSYMKRIVSDMVEKDTEQLKPQNFLRALRRFVFRYLSSERGWTDESTTLQSCLKEPSLWSPLQQPNVNVIPQDITLKYIHSVLNYLEEEEEKDKKVCTSRQPLRSSLRQPPKTRQAGGRRLKNFTSI